MTKKELQAKLKELDVPQHPVITKTIPFTNDDVPLFLEKLDKFEEESRKHSLRIL